jgi:hypothetical protein
MSFGLGFWAAAGGVVEVPAFEQIATTLVSSTTASVTFDVTGLGASYRHLQIRSTTNTTATGVNATNLIARFNSDSGSNYAFHILLGEGSSVMSAAATSQTSVAIGDMPNNASIFGGAVTDILDFASITKNKTIRSLIGVHAPSSLIRVALRSGVWLNTAAITSITLSPASDSLKTGSRFSLYGVKG